MFFRRKSYFWWVLLPVIGPLAGCVSDGSEQERRALPLSVPQNWVSGEDFAEVEPWFPQLESSELEILLEEAVGTNFDLQAALQRVETARAQARVTESARLPQIDVAANATRTKVNEDTGAVNNPSSNFRIQGEVSWEVDVWGRLSDATNAAIADYRVSQLNYESARLSLAAGVARQWLNLIEARRQLALARETVENFEKSLGIIQSQYRKGIGEALDLRLARNNLATAEANLQLRLRTSRSTARSLETLLGRYPTGSITVPESFPPLQDTVPAGLPADLLHRRPDVVAAEFRLTAAGHRFSEARKNRLPGLRLAANSGTTSDRYQEVIDLDFVVWSLLASVVQPVFQGGRLEAERQIAAARENEEFNAYVQTVLNAFQEVETALDSEAFLLKQAEALRRAAAEAQAAEQLATDQYRLGLGNIIALLESQRRAFNASSSLLEVINQRLQNRVNLYLALGGDFEPPDEVDETAHAE